MGFLFTYFANDVKMFELNKSEKKESENVDRYFQYKAWLFKSLVQHSVERLMQVLFEELEQRCSLAKKKKILQIFLFLITYA